MYPEQQATQSTGALEKKLRLGIERVTRTKDDLVHKHVPGTTNSMAPGNEEGAISREARYHDGEVGHARQEQE